MERAKKRHTMTQLETIKVSDLLRSRCIAVDGVAHYEDGWNDQRVVDEIGTVTLVNVENLRKIVVGPLYKPEVPASLEELERRVKALETWAAARPVAKFIKE